MSTTHRKYLTRNKILSCATLWWKPAMRISCIEMSKLHFVRYGKVHVERNSRKPLAASRLAHTAACIQTNAKKCLYPFRYTAHQLLLRKSTGDMVALETKGQTLHWGLQGLLRVKTTSPSLQLLRRCTAIRHRRSGKEDADLVRGFGPLRPCLGWTDSPHVSHKDSFYQSEKYSS